MKEEEGRQETYNEHYLKDIEEKVKTAEGCI
jgi:hypothetical protein